MAFDVKDLQKMMEMKAEINRLKEKVEQYEALALADGLNKLANSKRNSYLFTDGVNELMVINKFSTDVFRPDVIKDLLNDPKGVLVKEETKFKVAQAVTKAAIAIATESIIEEDMESALNTIANAIDNEDVTPKVLKKKLKADYNVNVKTLMNYGLSAEMANDYSYLYEEVANYENLQKLYKTSKYSGTLKEFSNELLNCLNLESTVALSYR